jgi:hypothetical protein
VSQLHELIRGDERELCGDGAYWNAADRRSFVTARVRYLVTRRGHRYRPLSEQNKRVNQVRSRIRACSEHAFHVVKRLWGFAKVRYRGLEEHGPRVCRLRPGEPVHGQAKAAPSWGVVSPRAGRMRPEPEKKRRTTPESATFSRSSVAKHLATPSAALKHGCSDLP